MPVDEAATAPEDAPAGAQPAESDVRASNSAAAGIEAEAADSDPAESAGPIPIESRFLYVDVAAQRAKQLRRGALPRLDDVPALDLDNPDSSGNRLKLERVAMREVDAGKIVYEVPTDDGSAKAD